MDGLNATVLPILRCVDAAAAVGVSVSSKQQSGRGYSFLAADCHADNRSGIWHSPRNTNKPGPIRASRGARPAVRSATSRSGRGLVSASFAGAAIARPGLRPTAGPRGRCQSKDQRRCKQRRDLVGRYARQRLDARGSVCRRWSPPRPASNLPKDATAAADPKSI
jgi:hypothetical protein